MLAVLHPIDRSKKIHSRYCCVSRRVLLPPWNHGILQLKWQYDRVVYRIPRPMVFAASRKILVILGGWSMIVLFFHSFRIWTPGMQRSW